MSTDVLIHPSSCATSTLTLLLLCHVLERTSKTVEYKSFFYSIFILLDFQRSVGFRNGNHDRRNECLEADCSVLPRETSLIFFNLYLIFLATCISFLVLIFQSYTADDNVHTKDMSRSLYVTSSRALQLLSIP